MVQMTSPGGASLAVGSRHQPSASQARWQGWGSCSAFYEGKKKLCPKVSFHELEHLLAWLSKTPLVFFQPCSSFGVCFAWDPLVCWPWHPCPMSSCPSPTAVSVLGKSSSSIRSTHGCGFGGYDVLCPPVIESEECFTEISAPCLQEVVGNTCCVSARGILWLIRGLKNSKMVKCDPRVLLSGS